MTTTTSVPTELTELTELTAAEALEIHGGEDGGCCTLAYGIGWAIGAIVAGLAAFADGADDVKGVK